MIRSIIAALLCLFIAGCATDTPPRIEVQQVKVEIPVKRVPPAALMECGYRGPTPAWLPVDGKPAWAALDEQGQRITRDLIVTIAGCNAAWKAWATAP